jgi:pimeloyl-ACP methyl ester carboxylesterase
VDSHYRTLPEPEHSLVLGASHGGLAAFYTASQYPDCFRCVAALSPSFWVGLDAAGEPDLFELMGPAFGSLQFSALWYAAAPTLQDCHRRLRIYLDWGLVREGGWHNKVIEARATARGREMRDLLVGECGYREGENLFVVEDAWGEHTEESWSARLENVLPIFLG